MGCSDRRHVVAAIALALLLGAAAGSARAEPSTPPHEVGLLVGGSFLGSPGLQGTAFTLGVRYRPIPYLALSFDAGYGFEARAADVQDRWWLMPGVALVLPAGAVQLELGAGLGLGATSGYSSWPAYVAEPFNPRWALQLVPTVRAHFMTTTRLARRVDLFLRFDAATLLLDGNSIGSRVGLPNPSVTDTTWFDVTVGIQIRLGPG